MTQQKKLEWDQRAEVLRISLGYEGRRPTSDQDETEWEWEGNGKPLLLYLEPPCQWWYRTEANLDLWSPRLMCVCVLLPKLQ